jgi:mannose-6-phosphate isomerase-like protein (cupin superfamily)
MTKLNVKDLPIAVNVCEQVLREVEHNLNWSMAHVIMNPMAASLLHNHHRMIEIYVITKGYGELGLGISKPNGCYHEVVAGSVYEVPVEVPHMLRNMSGGHLEHLVFALPPFDPADVHLLGEKRLAEEVNLLSLPNVQECFDGARILPYAFPHLDLSIAFGWVINDPARRKRPHYHKKIREFIFVVEGRGFIEIDRARKPIQAGDWIVVEPEAEHALINESPEDMVVVCTCSPVFEMEDVHYYDD